MHFEGEIRKDGTKIRQNNGRKHLEIRGPGCGMVKADDSRVSSSFPRNRGSSVSLEPTLRAGCPRNLGSASGSVQTGFEAHPAS